jgi:ribosomal protein S18 acetylase RimI-like enzyme
MAVWRTMSPNDIPGVLRVADIIHPNLPESPYVFTERMTLFPEGCLVLIKDNQVCGYAISHPIRYHQPPALDSLLGSIAPDAGGTQANQYYIHDLAILPEFRGQGIAAECMSRLLIIAKRYPSTCLVSVYGTAEFWARFGFVIEPIDAGLSKKLQDYGDDAVYLERQNN